MGTEEINALRRVADEIWELARDLDERGFQEAAELVKDASTCLHDKARVASLKGTNK